VPESQPSPELKSAQTAAQASWLALLVPIPVRILLQSYAGEAGSSGWMLAAASSLVTLVCILIGIGAGAFALTRISKVGQQGVLLPALIGLTLNLAFLALLVVAFMRAAAR